MNLLIRRLAIMAVTIVLITAVTLIVINLKSPQLNIDHDIQMNYSVRDPQFVRALGHLLGPPVVSGNKVAAYYNGNQIFPAMLEGIRKAQKTITFESYIYWSGKIGEQFKEALIERSKAGVKIHVLIDWLGSRAIAKNYFTEMHDVGIEVAYFHPLAWYSLSRINNRTHRKLLVIDGKIGFTGGVGISDDWAGDGNHPDIWRDSHYKIEGPAVRYLQSAFMDNWLKTRPEVHHDETYFPEVAKAGPAEAQVFKSSPLEGSSSMRLMYLMAIAAAKKNILLESAYFVPDDLAIKEFLKARSRGVKIQIIVPGPFIDAKIVRNASRAKWGPLLESGIEIYEYTPARFHCKVLIVDDYFVSVGSTNFDDRSFRLNYEANLNIFDGEFANSESKTFELDRLRSKRIATKDWLNRPFADKIQEWLASQFRSQL